MVLVSAAAWVCAHRVGERAVSYRIRGIPECAVLSMPFLGPRARTDLSQLRARTVRFGCTAVATSPAGAARK